VSGPEIIASLAVSADGFVADRDGGVGFLDGFDPSSLGFDAFLAGIDTVVMGRTTFDQVQGFGAWPYAGKHGLLLTSRAAYLPEGMVAVAPEARCITPALAGLKARRVWVVGGPRTVALCLGAGLLDRIELHVIPRTIGAGIPLALPPACLALDAAEAVGSSVARLCWRVQRP
jgi:dihydrofolate reductase